MRQLYPSQKHLSRSKILKKYLAEVKIWKQKYQHNKINVFRLIQPVGTYLRQKIDGYK